MTQTPANWAKHTVLVTGAASGIGLAVATAFAEHGAQIVLTDRDGEALETAVAKLKAAGHWVAGQVADAASEDDWRGVFQSVEGAGRPVDILVNNAGFQHVDPIDVFPVATFTQLLHVMAVGPFMAIQLALPAMRRQRWGRIINVASINGLVGFAGKAGYNTAKHALIGLTRVAALETAEDGITVNALCPGYVDTPLVRGQLEDLARTRGVPMEAVLNDVIYPLVPQRRLLDPKEVADYAVFLASEQGRSITGQAVVIDGGYLAQ